MESKKYPRTLHFQFSPEIHSDDKVQFDISNLIGKPIVITYKLDGGNTTLKKGGPFARSHATPTRCESFDYIKATHQFPKQHLFDTFNYHGENLFAIHSIKYHKLTDYFYLFGVSHQTSDEFLSWTDTELHAKKLDFKLVPVLFSGIIHSESELKRLLSDSISGDCPLGGEAVEGFVVRVANSFPISEFSKNVVKYVRKGHVQTDKHWSNNWKPNILLK